MALGSLSVLIDADQIISTVDNVFSDDLDHRTQLIRLNELLDVVLCNDNEQVVCNHLCIMTEAVVNKESVSMVVSRQFIGEIIAVLDRIKPRYVKELAKSLLQIVQARLISYEEQVSQLRFILADIYQEEGNIEEAAKLLMAIPLETGQRTYSSELKMRTYMRIAQLALEYGNAVEAESFINRASVLFGEISKENEMLATFKALYAKVLDHRKKFIEAAQRYYDLSLLQNFLTNAGKMEALTNAISCTILASPGAQRSRMLTTLYKDERCVSLPAYGVLQKMYFDRLIRNEEVSEFEKSLCSHQRTIQSGWSVLQRAIVEHNFIAISKMFINITFEQLAGLLDTDFRQAQKMAWNMFAEDRVGGYIDQIQGIIHFTPTWDEEAEQTKKESTQEALLEWDQHVAGVCQQLNVITDLIIENCQEWLNERKKKA